MALFQNSSFDHKNISPRLRNTFISLSLAIVGSMAVAGCSSNDTSLRDEADALSLATAGQWSQATPLAERAYAANPTVINESNLALMYQHTGQFAKAAALYRQVVAQGQYVSFASLDAIDADHRPGDPNLLPRLSDEAADQQAHMAINTLVQEARARSIQTGAIAAVPTPAQAGEIAAVPTAP